MRPGITNFPVASMTIVPGPGLMLPRVPICWMRSPWMRIAPFLIAGFAVPSIIVAWSTTINGTARGTAEIGAPARRPETRAPILVGLYTLRVIAPPYIDFAVAADRFTLD